MWRDLLELKNQEHPQRQDTTLSNDQYKKITKDRENQINHKKEKDRETERYREKERERENSRHIKNRIGYRLENRCARREFMHAHEAGRQERGYDTRMIAMRCRFLMIDDWHNVQRQRRQTKNEEVN